MINLPSQSRPLVFSSLVIIWAAAGAALADEGMWPYNAPPLKQWKEKYQFKPTPAWLDHLQKASVRFNSGGSGSFVSANGLVITNHHVGADALQKFGDEQHNYLRDGFYAKANADEKRCTDLELNVLMSIEDVSTRVNAAVKSKMSSEASAAARRSVIAAIEKESKEETGLRSDVVTLYQGGAYHLYRFKRYDDVRLVFAPEQQIAFYGGDPDNFEYPRYDLDICIFRVYEEGQPAKIDQFLKFNAAGPADGDLVFVSGHPGKTDRQLTIAELTDMRDRSLPGWLEMFRRREVLLTSYSERSNENARRARDDFFGVQNNRKRYNGMLAGLLDPALFEKLSDHEKNLRAQISGRATKEPQFKPALAAYDRIAAAQKAIAKNAKIHDYLEIERPRSATSYRPPRALYGTLFQYARMLVRAGDEQTKPNGERLPEFRDSAKDSLELQLFSEQPVYDDYEQLTLADSLTDFACAFGVNHPLAQKVLAGKSPHDRATELVSGTKLKDAGLRKQLYAGGVSAIAAAHDPMIDLARAIEGEARAARKTFEAQDETKQQAYGEIARARFAIEGTNTYPDATFTLRVSYGTVRGYEENGNAVPAFTDFRGLYQRAADHANNPPFDLPLRWNERKNRIKADTRFNFVCDADIIGGNSGSPVVNKAGEFVGIIFDGNIQSLVLDDIYDDKEARAVSVDSAAIIEALRTVYDAAPLADELMNTK